ncbi:hypothetical protein EDD21DRAFT_362703 [Dissophora ornata]|nr:hypothetical protein EDD21DRAFT_362703 [Dissophora ornata]
MAPGGSRAVKGQGGPWPPLFSVSPLLASFSLSLTLFVVHCPLPSPLPDRPICRSSFRARTKLPPYNGCILMSFESPSPAHHLHHRPGPANEALAALKIAASASFFSDNHQNNSTPTQTPAAARLPALQPITTAMFSPVRSTHPYNKLDHPHPTMVPTRGPSKPLTLQHHAAPHASQTGLQTPQTPHFRTHHSHPHMSSLPSPPLSSVEPPHNSGFFPKSPLQERCEALETELSALRLRLKRSERSSTFREKRLSLFQQQSSDTQQSLQSLMLQYETTLSQLQDSQQELSEAKVTLSNNKDLIRQLENTTQEQESKLCEILTERETLSAEMMESYTENTKQQKRLNTSTEKVERLQQENRQLIEQLKELRTKVVEVSGAQLDVVESLDREKTRGGQAVIELEKEVNKYKAEVDRLQDLVLMMGNRHVQVQAQLSFFQQQAQQLQQQLDQSQQQTSFANSLEHTAGTSSNKAHSPNSSTTATSTAAKHGSLIMGDSTLTSLLTSVASVAATSHSRRTKLARRFTVNAPRKDGELTLEQRKCEFLMDQISVLQRGYDALRQDKVTLELQLDLMQRQHQYHQQQRQKRRDSQRRTLGHEQSSALSKALAIMVSSSTSTPSASAASGLSTIPSTPLLPTISAAEQEREKARIQYELEQAQIRAQKEAEEKELQRLAAKAAAEEAEREAIRLRRAKSIHLKETLASLESKRTRSDSATIQFSSSEELKHLENFRLANEQSQVSGSFHSAAAARASRRMVSPFSSSSRSSSMSPSFPSPSPLSAITTPGLSSSSSSSSPSSLSHSLQAKQLVPYTHSSKHQHSASQSHQAYTYNIDQCSCCLGPMIEI